MNLVRTTTKFHETQRKTKRIVKSNRPNQSLVCNKFIKKNLHVFGFRFICSVFVCVCAYVYFGYSFTVNSLFSVVIVVSLFMGPDTVFKEPVTPFRIFWLM